MILSVYAVESEYLPRSPISSLLNRCFCGCILHAFFPESLRNQDSQNDLHREGRINCTARHRCQCRTFEAYLLQTCWTVMRRAGPRRCEGLGLEGGEQSALICFAGICFNPDTYTFSLGDIFHFPEQPTLLKTSSRKRHSHLFPAAKAVPWLALCCGSIVQSPSCRCETESCNTEPDREGALQLNRSRRSKCSRTYQACVSERFPGTRKKPERIGRHRATSDQAFWPSYAHPQGCSWF